LWICHFLKPPELILRNFKFYITKNLQKIWEDMGIIRLFLALSVVIYHCYPVFGVIKLVDGMTAVQAFFIISGFYMALFLNSSNIKPKQFYIRRYLRLWPVYFVVFIFSVICLKLPDTSSLSIIEKTFLLFTNIFLIGQGLHFFTERWLGIYYPLYQAWTIGLELFFYLIAPFILRVKNKLLYYSVIFFASFTLRLYLYFNGHFNDPWDYRFFPTELGLFMAGALAYLLYEKIKESNLKNLGHVFAIIITAMLFIIPLLKPHVLFHFELNCWLFYSALTLSIPFIFLTYKDNKIDRWIGELSYPVYLVHFFVMREIGHWHFFKPQLGFWVCVVSILLSIPLIKYVQMPIDNFRKRNYHARETLTPADQLAVV
jgi:peptidoglycan/LPS O-acetylase OafA/YrhL